MVMTDFYDWLSTSYPSIGGWVTRAACKNRDPNIFFPRRGHSLEEAYKLCSTCEVKMECREYAINNPALIGVWGGMSEVQRRMRRNRRRGGY